MATLSFDAVEKRYGAVRVLHRVDLEVADGEFVTLYASGAPNVDVTVAGPCTVGNCQFIMEGPTTVTFTFTPR